MPAELLPLHRAILATVAALDAFDFPPSDRDVWRYLFAVDPRKAGLGGESESFGLELPVGYETVAEALTDLVGLRRLSAREGRYFLPHREELLKIHDERLRAAPKKWRRAKTVAEFLRLTPFVEFMGVCNNLAIDNAAPESDIDVVFVIRDGRLWLTRALITGIVQMLGLRRHGDRITDRICLSFFLTASAQNLEPLALSPADPYLALWVAQVVPVLDRQGSFGRFRTANAWVEKILPNAFADVRSDQRVGFNAALAATQRLYEQGLMSPMLGAPLEAWARTRQRARMEDHWWSRSKAGGSDVVISDMMLKFHESDRRTLYREKIAKRVAAALD